MSNQITPPEIDDRPKTPLQIFFRIVIILFVLIAGFFILFTKDIAGNTILACYIGFILIWFLAFHSKAGINFLTVGRKPGWMPLLMFTSFVVIPVAAGKHAFNKMALLNNNVIIFAILFAVVFALVSLYKNKNIPQTGIENYSVFVGVIGLILGYGFALIYNCAEISETTETVCCKIVNTHIETAQGKNGKYYIYDFETELWPYTGLFGNKIQIVPKWFYKYDNLDKIDVGDSVCVKVHTGVLRLIWMEPLEFTEKDRSLP